MAEKRHSDIIDLRDVISKVWNRRKTFYILWPVAAVSFYLLILCVPRYYTAEARLVPELGGNIGGGALGDLASSFGFDLGGMESTDAISPLLYPDLMEDNGFVTSLFNIRVRTLDGTIDTNYFTYQKKHQKSPWWSKSIGWLKKLIKKKKNDGSGDSKFDPYNLTEEVNDIVEGMRSNITISVDRKTGVIGVMVKAQDKLVCKTLTDSIVVRLQDFITAYRTNKAHIDEKHYEELSQQAWKEYEEARKAYASFSDSHTNTILSTMRTQEESLLNNMQLKYTTFTSLSAQLQQARAKVQERTPAFTLLKGSSVPIKPAGPKRIMFVFVMLFLLTMGTIVSILKDDLFKPFMKRPEEAS